MQVVRDRGAAAAVQGRDRTGAHQLALPARKSETRSCSANVGASGCSRQHARVLPAGVQPGTGGHATRTRRARAHGDTRRDSPAW